MTTQAIPAVSADWTPLIPKLRFTGDAKKIAPFLDAADSVRVLQVSKLWSSNPHFRESESLKALREDLICVQEGFPEEVVKAFRAKKISLWRLPVIASEKIPQQDYFTVGKKDMPHGASLARFKDRRDRVGLSLDVRGNIDRQVERNYRGQDESFNIRDFKGVVSVFRRYPDADQWVKDCGIGDEMLKVYDDVHKPNHTGPSIRACPTCPTFVSNHSDGCKEFVIRMISGTDPVFKLAKEVEMVATPPPLPKLLPKPKPAPKEEPMTFCSCIAAIFEWIVSCVSSLLTRLGL